MFIIELLIKYINQFIFPSIPSTQCNVRGCKQNGENIDILGMEVGRNSLI